MCKRCWWKLPSTDVIAADLAGKQLVCSNCGWKEGDEIFPKYRGSEERDR